MVKKDKKWEWTEKQERAFGELKRRFTEEPVLAAPDLDKKMQMEVDVSNYVTVELLSMECEDNLWRPVFKNEKSRLNIFYFFLILLPFILLYSIFRIRVRVRVTRSCCHTAGHIR